MNLEIVNVVGSGALGVELDLERVARDIGSIADYDPEKYPGVYLRLEADAPLITLYRTGKYITTGANSKEEAYSIRQRFLELLTDMAIIETPEDEWFQIQNLVCTGELDRSVNLSALAVGLGLELTEYEPEQFPGLIYRPPGRDVVVLIFATGKKVLTGAKSVEDAEQSFEDLSERTSTLL